MTAAIIIIIAAAAVFILYLLSLRCGNGRREQMRPFTERYIAHRGLFNNEDIPENSLKAFEKAAAEGYGIELDVQLTSDDRLVVFHDGTLKRMCGDRRMLHTLSFEELNELRLLETQEKIPLFDEVLKLVGGRAPLIVEIKREGRYMRTAELTAKALDVYKGIYCIESFHPLVVEWFRKNRPHVIRGQLAARFRKVKGGLPGPLRFALTNLMVNFKGRPDFIAYDHRNKDQFSYRLCRKLYHPVNAAWTIKSGAELEAARDVFDIFIFDSFIP